MILVMALFIPVTLYFGIDEVRRLLLTLRCEHRTLIVGHRRGLDNYCLDCEKIFY